MTADMENLFGSICLTDIPKELITVGKNGKKYLNIVINARREASQYGHTHYIKAYCKREQQRDGVNYYIGELKPSKMQSEQPHGHAQQPANVQTDNDDLPF